jgi:dolichol-phosphate mannosyltransferase
LSVSLFKDAVITAFEDCGYDYEIVFVNDGSTDATDHELRKLYNQQRCPVRVVELSRNFGKEAAMFAGLSAARGACVAVLDCDLQHPPQKLVEMYGKWEEGYEVIEGVKTSRGKESKLHAFCAKKFYDLISGATGVDMSRASDFKLLDRKAVDAILSLKEKHAFFRALSSWVGFKTCSVPFEVQERTAGESKWSKRALIRYAVNNITSFSTLPMKLITWLGVFVFCLSVVVGGIALVQKIAGVAVTGFTTVIILQLMIGSVLMISLGIIGYYIGKIYEELQGRPRYIVSQTVEHED